MAVCFLEEGPFKPTLFTCYKPGTQQLVSDITLFVEQSLCQRTKVSQISAPVTAEMTCKNHLGHDWLSPILLLFLAAKCLQRFSPFDLLLSGDLGSRGEEVGYTCPCVSMIVWANLSSSRAKYYQYCLASALK